MLPAVFYAASAGVSVWTSHLGKKVAVAQHPQVVGRLGVYLPAVSAAVSQEWVAHNAAVRVVPERPRWRRYPSQV